MSTPLKLNNLVSLTKETRFAMDTLAANPTIQNEAEEDGQNPAQMQLVVK